MIGVVENRDRNDPYGFGIVLGLRIQSKPEVNLLRKVNVNSLR